jgi:hypothetical protein
MPAGNLRHDDHEGSFRFRESHGGERGTVELQHGSQSQIAAFST